MEAGLPPRPAKPLPPCVPFLPQDNDAAACDPSASAVVALLNDRLGRLLRSDAPTFWAHLAHDASIANALDTYLQFRRRPHDARLDGDVTNAASAEEHDLARRVFLVHRRVGDGGEPNAPALATRSAIVRHRKLVDPPKVLDLCALYGPDNPRDLERVLARLVETRDAEPSRLEVYDSTRAEDSARNQTTTLGDAFADAGAAIAANLEQMADRVVTSAIDESMALSRDATKDALRYFHDVAASLALLARHAPALARRCKGDAAKDERRALSTTKGLSGLSAVRSEHLDTASIGKGKAPMSSLSSLTLGPSTDSDLGFVTCAPESLCDALERVARETCGALGGAAGLGDASAGSSSSSSRIEPSIADAANAVRAAVLRGRDALLALDGDEGGGTSRDAGPDANVRAYGTVAHAEQFSIDASAAPPPPAALARKVREVRELFPEHGEGFLAAALEAFGNDVSETASRLFEGDLPPALAAMDVGADWAAYWAEKNPVPGDGGKRDVDSNTNDATMGDTRRMDDGSFATDSSVWRNGVSDESVSFARRVDVKTETRGDAAYHKNGDVAYMTRRQKSAYGFENGYDASEAKRHILDLAYDDEYDDSFDELNELAGAVADAGDAAERRPFGVFGGGVFGGHTGGGAPGVTKKTFWIENGRVYHAARPGATAVTASSVEEASALAAREAATVGAQVLGLGAGGNRAAFGAAGARPASSVSHARGGGRGGRGGRGAPPSDLTRPDPRPPPGSSAGPNRRGAGAPAGTRAHKNEHKASIGNHNRKKAAAKKMSKGFVPAPTGGE